MEASNKELDVYLKLALFIKKITFLLVISCKLGSEGNVTFDNMNLLVVDGIRR